MAGLPHYKNSSISMNMYEPIYLNLFDVVITLPPLIAGNDVKLFLESITKIDGLDVNKVPTAEVVQYYKGAPRRFAGAGVAERTVNISVSFEVNLDDNNSAFTYNTLRQWCDLIFDVQTGAMHLKKDYVGGPMTISIYNRRGDVHRQLIFPTVWPITNIKQLTLDYNNPNEIYRIEDFQFAADYWEDMSV